MLKGRAAAAFAETFCGRRLSPEIKRPAFLFEKRGAA